MDEPEVKHEDNVESGGERSYIVVTVPPFKGTEYTLVKVKQEVTDQQDDKAQDGVPYKNIEMLVTNIKSEIHEDNMENGDERSYAQVTVPPFDRREHRIEVKQETTQQADESVPYDDIEIHEMDVKCKIEKFNNESVIDAKAGPSVPTKLDKKYECDVCQKRFKWPSELNSHKRSHSEVKPYECDVCQKRFTQTSSLNEHKRIHSGEKPYRCNTCQKRFTVLSNLKSHKRIHSGEKPYQCNICQKRFDCSSHLNSHKRIHSGEKPYECNVCQKRFAQSSNLTSHKRIHSGEKPYECNICLKKFNQSSHLSLHKRIHS